MPMIGQHTYTHERGQYLLAFVTGVPRQLHASNARDVDLGTQAAYLHCKQMISEKVQAKRASRLTVSATSARRKCTCRSPFGILVIWLTSPKLYKSRVRYQFGETSITCKLYLTPPLHALKLANFIRPYTADHQFLLLLLTSATERCKRHARKGSPRRIRHMWASRIVFDRWRFLILIVLVLVATLDI